jgi:hypothetical protein
MGVGFLLANPACSRSDQSCRYLHKGNAGWCSFLALARFLYVSTVRLSLAVSFRCSSLVPAGQAPPTAGYTVRGFFVCVYQQGFVSFGVMLLSVMSDLGGDFTSFQCQLSYHQVASSSCAFRTDMNFRIHPGWILFFPSVLDARMGGVGLSLACFFLVVRSFKISKALTFTISTHFKSFLLPDAFAGREGQTPPFKGWAHNAPALATTTLIFLQHTKFLKNFFLNSFAPANQF